MICTTILSLNIKIYLHISLLYKTRISLRMQQGTTNSLGRKSLYHNTRPDFCEPLLGASKAQVTPTDQKADDDSV